MAAIFKPQKAAAQGKEEFLSGRAAGGEGKNRTAAASPDRAILVPPQRTSAWCR